MQPLSPNCSIFTVPAMVAHITDSTCQARLDYSQDRYQTSMPLLCDATWLRTRLWDTADRTSISGDEGHVVSCQMVSNGVCHACCIIFVRLSAKTLSSVESWHGMVPWAAHSIPSALSCMHGSVQPARGKQDAAGSH